MGKSLENAYTLYDLEKEGYEPLSLRYLYLQTHYRQEMNFTFPSLDAASTALRKLRLEVATWDDPEGSVKEYEERFFEALNEDLNIPKALGVVWELVKSDHPTGAKAKSIFKMDTVLGLDLHDASLGIKKELGVIPGNVQQLLEERQSLREQKRFSAADQVRNKIEKLGYEIEDSKKGTKVSKKT
jgi:cysteinyl-tRNA synthetase